MNFLTYVLLFACGDAPTKSEPAETKAVEQKPIDQKQVDQKKPKVELKPKKDATVNSNKAFNPLAGKSVYEICASAGLSLIQWSFDVRQQNDVCCGDERTDQEREDLSCELDWPSSDVPSCDMYDEMRNEIFARYGRAFKTPKWQKYFGKTSWYKVNKEFSYDWLTPVAKANIDALKNMKKEKRGCIP